MSSLCRALYRLLKAWCNSRFISVGCWERIPPAWCKVCTTHSAVIPAVHGISHLEKKSAFFTFIRIPFKKAQLNWKRPLLFQVYTKSYTRRLDAALCWHSRHCFVLFTLTWKDWAPPTTGSLQVRLMTCHSRDILILCLSPPLHMDIQ